MKFPAFEPIKLQETINDDGFEILSIANIYPDQNQPRKTFDDQLLEELAASIKEHGILQPILVMKIENEGNYLIIAGERRWRAAKMAGLEYIPAIIRNFDNSEKKVIALIENIQRQDLNPLEEAQAIQVLLEQHEMSHSQVAKSIGKSRSTISNILRLTKLEDYVKGLVNDRLIETGHAKALLGLSGHEQIETANLIIKKNMSVRQAEKYVRRSLYNLGSYKIQATPELDKKIHKWQEVIAEYLSRNVQISTKNNGNGTLIIHFESIKDIQDLIYDLMDITLS